MIRNSFTVASFLLAVAFALVSCGPSNSDFGSLEPGGSPTARYRSDLELPPDLVDTSGQALLANRAKEDSEQKLVLPKIDNLQIKRNDKEGWIEVNADADLVWRELVDHWSSLGIKLVRADPTTGIMVTDWVVPAGVRDNDEGLFGSMVGDFLGKLLDQATLLDKYTIQLERLGPDRTRIDVSHRGIKKVLTQKASKQHVEAYDWVDTGPQPAKVKQVLTSIVYGLGGKS